MLCFQIHYSVIMKTFVAVDTVSSLLLVSAAVYSAIQALEYNFSFFNFMIDVCIKFLIHKL